MSWMQWKMPNPMEKMQWKMPNAMAVYNRLERWRGVHGCSGAETRKHWKFPARPKAEPEISNGRLILHTETRRGVFFIIRTVAERGRSYIPYETPNSGSRLWKIRCLGQNHRTIWLKFGTKLPWDLTQNNKFQIFEILPQTHFRAIPAKSTWGSKKTQKTSNL